MFCILRTEWQIKCVLVLAKFILRKHLCIEPFNKFTVMSIFRSWGKSPFKIKRQKLMFPSNCKWPRKISTLVLESLTKQKSDSISK